MKTLFLLLLIPSYFQLQAQDNPLVEIYLLKNRISTIENRNWPSSVVNHFYANSNDLLDTAFIKDSEIISYDSSTFKLKVTKSASLKIAYLEPPIPKGIQFVITVNKEPVLNGYFINKFTSIPVFSYMIMNHADSVYTIDRLMPDVIIDDRKGQKLIDNLLSTGRMKK